MSDFQSDVNDVLCDAKDVRSALSNLHRELILCYPASDFNNGYNFIINYPKDNNGSEITIGECLDNIIETLEKWDG